MERNQNQSPVLSVRCFKQDGAEERDQGSSYASDIWGQAGENADESSLHQRIGRLLNMLDK